MKTRLLHHLKQTSCQSMHNRISFRTSNFTCAQKLYDHQNPIEFLKSVLQSILIKKEKNRYT